MPLTIIVQGGTNAGIGTAGRFGRITRLDQMRKAFGCLPAWRCETVLGDLFYLCGKCFEKRGDGPATNDDETWIGGMPGGVIVPPHARCEDCGGRAWPAD